MRTASACALIAALLLVIWGGPAVFAQTPAGQAPPAPAPSGRIVVHDETQLPRFSYPMATAPSTLLVADDATFAPFAAAVGADVDKTLRDYDIQDLGALRDFIETKVALQLLAHDEDGARATIAALRAAESKADLKLLAGRLALVQFDADAQAKQHPGTDATQYFAAIDRAATDALPWDVVADTIKEDYGGERVASKDAIVGFVAHDLDPIAKKSGTLDGPSARALVQTRAELIFDYPLFAADAPILKDYIGHHDVVKPDIWAVRDVALTPAQVKAPVVIGIWDSGVDPSAYPASLYVDRNGRHGIAFSVDASPSSSYLYPLPRSAANQYAFLARLISGESDLETAIDSPDAQAFVAYEKSLSPAQAAAFAYNFGEVDEYTHGSHVAGIAVRGNPGARIAIARFDDNLPDYTFAPTLAWANRMAADFAAFGAYFRANHVRVVNISWGDDVNEFEQWLAKTDKTSDPQTRERMARQLFAIWRKAIENVIVTTPDTLFITTAGNEDSNASFDQTVPSSLQSPNLITVGAVNQAGDATSFTSYGPLVAVYADGFHVPSKIPGGYTVKLSGTSMAAPYVANLAGKLLALDPALTPVQVRALIVDGATPSDDGKRKLVNPKRSVALLAKMNR